MGLIYYRESSYLLTHASVACMERGEEAREPVMPNRALFKPPKSKPDKVDTGHAREGEREDCEEI